MTEANPKCSDTNSRELPGRCTSPRPYLPRPLWCPSLLLSGENSRGGISPGLWSGRFSCLARRQGNSGCPCRCFRHGGQGQRPHLLWWPRLRTPAQDEAVRTLPRNSHDVVAADPAKPLGVAPPWGENSAGPINNRPQGRGGAKRRFLREAPWFLASRGPHPDSLLFGPWRRRCDRSKGHAA